MVAASGGAQRRRTTSSRGGSTGGNPNTSMSGGAENAGLLRFYTDDAPGLKIGPTTVLVLSLAFIGFVVLLHIWGKLSK